MSRGVGAAPAAVPTAPSSSRGSTSSASGVPPTEVWGWEDSQSYGPMTCAPMDFRLPTCAELHLKVTSYEGGAHNLLGEATLRIDQEVLPLAQAYVPVAVPGAGAHLALPLELEGIECGSLSLICRVCHEDPRQGLVSCAKLMEVDYVLAECGGSLTDVVEDSDAIWSPRGSAPVAPPPLH